MKHHDGEEAMTITPAPGLLEPAKQPFMPQQEPATTPGYTIECSVAHSGTKAPSYSPCLVNLLLDPSHPHHFALTPERLEKISGAPGSCLDAFGTHVAATIGTDPFLRAMGSVDPESLCTLFEKALASQCMPTSKAASLAEMAARAGLALLTDRIAKNVLAKLETHDLVSGMLLEDRSLRSLLLVRVSEIEQDQVKVKLLKGFGLGSIAAAKVAKLLGPWIPQEIRQPTTQSAGDVAKADAILVNGLEGVHQTISGIEPEIRHWQVSKQIDIIADFEPEVLAAYGELGLGASSKGSALDLAVEAHLARVRKERSVELGLGLVVDLVTGMAQGKVPGLITAIPGILAEKKKLDDLTLLQGVGAASTEAVEMARARLLTSIVAVTVDVIM
jgi:hypothetical protein